MLLLIAYLVLGLISWYFKLYLGFLAIVFIPFVLFFVLCLILKTFYGIDIASANDFLCAHAQSDDGNKSHIVAAVVYENKMDTEEVISKIKQRAFMHPYYEKLKMNLFIKDFFLFLIPYWTKYENFNIDDHISVKKTPVNTDQELFDMVAEHLSSTDFPPLKPKWEVVLIENFKETKSVFFMRIHHAYADGISNLSYFMNVTDCSNFEMINLKKIGRVEWLLALILGSFKIIITYYHFLTWKKDFNCFHTGRTTGKKRLYSMEACTVEDLKKASKAHDVTINDSLTAILCMSLHKYCKEKFNENVENILAMIPVSLRSLPKPGEFYPIDNFTSLIYTQMPIKHDENVFTISKFYCKYMKSLKNSYDVYVSKLAYEMMPYILTPYFLKSIIRFIANKVSFIFSNVPGPTNQLVCFGKYRVERIITSVNIFSDTLVVFSIVSYNNKVFLTCISDQEIDFCPKEFIEIFKSYLTNDVLGK